MPTKYKLSAILVFLVSVLFFLFFEISKHNPLFSPSNAFAEDPYDGIGSMGIQAALLLAALSLLRAFWRYPIHEPSVNRMVIIARTQMMAVLAVGVTLTADFVAMLRYRSMWLSSAGGHLLAVLVAGLALLTATAGLFVYRQARGIALPKVPNVWSRAVAICFAAVFVLAFYPENWRKSTPGALLTVLVGTVLLVVPMWALGSALIPYREGIDRNDPARVALSYLQKYQWGFIVLAGAVAGCCIGLRELWEPGGWPQLTSRIVFVIAVYIGLETAGILIGYGFLRKPLGLWAQNSQHS